MSKYSREYYLKHRESILASQKKWREKNKEYRRKQALKYYYENKERAREYYDKNREKIIKEVVKYAKDNRSKIRKYRAAYYLKCKEKKNGAA